MFSHADYNGNLNVKDVRHSHGVWHNGMCPTVPSVDDIFYTI